jgi:hypothetical protein
MHFYKLHNICIKWEKGARDGFNNSISQIIQPRLVDISQHSPVCLKSKHPLVKKREKKGGGEEGFLKCSEWRGEVGVRVKGNQVFCQILKNCFKLYFQDILEDP